MKGPGQPCARDEGFLPQLFYRNITFLTFLKKVRNVRNVRYVMLRVAVMVKHDYISYISYISCERKGPGQLCAREEGARATLNAR